MNLSDVLLVNNAGWGTASSSLDMKAEDIARTFDVNVKGPIFVAQAAVPHMPPGGRVINITSTASKLGQADIPIYGASKAALDSLTWSWAKEVRKSTSNKRIELTRCSGVAAMVSLSTLSPLAPLSQTLSHRSFRKSCTGSTSTTLGLLSESAPLRILVMLFCSLCPKSLDGLLDSTFLSAVE